MTSDVAQTLGALTEAEVADQPRSWRTALGLPDQVLSLLPAPDERVLGIGCGTSYYAMEAYARTREQLGAGWTRAAFASELPADYDDYDVVLLLSRSGTTSDLLRAGATYRSRARLVALLGTPGSPAEELADDVVDLSFADDRSVVQTRFPTTVLALLRRGLGDPSVAALPDAAQDALDEQPVIGPGAFDHVVFLGTGASYPLAHEAALKLRESAALWTEAYPVGEYLHGPVACAGSRSLVWSLAPVPEAVARTIRATGAALRIASADPLVELVRVHRMAIAYARARGIDCDDPPFLSRSVTDGE
ncbi:MAG TPA: sugar isomerase [Pseudonocardia sp.]|nr:sugar isomerase [Pseudonocardia sp.]